MTVTAAFTPSDPAFVADPYPAYERLRAAGRVLYDPGSDHWLVPHHADDAAPVLAAEIDTRAERARALPVPPRSRLVHDDDRLASDRSARLRPRMNIERLIPNAGLSMP